MYDIKSIQAMYAGRAVEYSQHFRSRMKERNIKFADVNAAIQTGEIIEQDLSDFPNPSVLILGFTSVNKPMHVAIGVGDTGLLLITAYFPALSVWESDYKTRKADV